MRVHDRNTGDDPLQGEVATDSSTSISQENCRDYHSNRAGIICGELRPSASMSESGMVVISIKGKDPPFPQIATDSIQSSANLPSR